MKEVYSVGSLFQLYTEQDDFHCAALTAFVMKYFEKTVGSLVKKDVRPLLDGHHCE